MSSTTSAASTTAVHSQVVARARATIVLDHPFFASILLRHPMVADKSIPTCCVNGRGRIRYNPDFFESLTTKQVVWALCHEVLHYAGMDAYRIGTRDRRKWNWSADEWINDTLAQLNIGEPIPKTVSRPGASKFTREALYDMLPEDDGGKGSGKGKDKGNGQGNAPMSGDIDNEPGDGDSPADGPPGQGEAPSDLAAQIKIELAQAAQIAKAAGKLPGVLQDMVSAVVDSKVPWYDVLERFMSERVRNDYSWARPNRRYMPDHYLPTMDSLGSMGAIAVQVDISGSVSQEEIAHYNGHLKRIVEQCRPTKVHVIYTDTEVQRHDEFENPEDVEISFYSGGGTDMRAGFQYLEDNGVDAACVVTLTDGYTPFPEPGDFGFESIWCISNANIKATDGLTVPFEVER